MDQIADAAGVARSLVNHYFGSKRELFVAVVGRAVAVPPEVPLVPTGVSGSLAEVIGPCVDAWLDLIESTGGLWMGGSSVEGATDVDRVLAAARDRLVGRMVAELPFDPSLDVELLSAGLRSYAAFAKALSDEWLVGGSMSRSDAARLLERAFLDLVDSLGCLSESRSGAESPATPDQGRAVGGGGSR